MLLAIDGNRPIAVLPSVAVWAVKHTAPIELREPWDVGEVVADTGGDKQFSRVCYGAVSQRDQESAVLLALGIDRRDMTKTHRFVRFEFAPAKSEKFARRNAVAGQISMERV